MELYKQAGNYFKLDKNWEQSCDVYLQAAEIEAQRGEKTQAANNFVEAANVIKKVNNGKSTELLIKASQLFGEAGRFSMAARHRKSAAEIYEADLQYALAIESYQSAADMFYLENSDSTGNQCLLKVAELSTYEAPS